MRTELKAIRPEQLPAVLKVINESSAGHSFQFDLDLVKYLYLSRFWNFSYQHSYLALAESVPAGVLLNCVDPSHNEAFSFYWGVLPEFRKRPLSMHLARTYLREVKELGFEKTYAISSIDSPLNLYYKLGFRPHQHLVELCSGKVDAVPGNGITNFTIATLLDELESFPPDPGSWITRATFLQHAAPFLEILGIQQGERLVAWLALNRLSEGTTIVAFEFRPNAEDAARQLIAHLATRPAPVSASHVVKDSRADILLRQMGFMPHRERISLVLDLHTYLPSRK